MAAAGLQRLLDQRIRFHWWLVRGTQQTVLEPAKLAVRPGVDDALHPARRSDPDGVGVGSDGTGRTLWLLFTNGISIQFCRDAVMVKRALDADRSLT